MTNFNPNLNANFNSDCNPSSAYLQSSVYSPSSAYKRLERLYQSSSASRSTDFSIGRPNLFKQVGQWLLQFLTDSQQVRIWTKESGNGTLWYAYDPAIEQGIARVSEDELRRWLESRYQHSSQ
ncbi:MAG: hypothetical protein HC800_10270 [Phormidesmis sp. RL_2_1]|nr:hypothetical protein [Phormidesmis sp. RL_2_1]